MTATVASRITRSVRERGLTRTLVDGGRHVAGRLLGRPRDRLRTGIARLRLQIARFDDWYFDFRHGTDTGGSAPVSAFEVVGQNKAHGTGFQSTRPRPFRKVIRSLGYPPGSVFMDIGSGKGRMLLLAAEAGFRRAIGVEFIPALCEVARKNIQHYTARRGRRTEFEVHAADIVTHAFRGDENVFFVFNAFDDVLLRKVLARLAATLKEHPRKAWLVYANAAHHAVVVEQGVFRFSAHYRFPGEGRDILVYVHEPVR